MALFASIQAVVYELNSTDKSCQSQPLSFKPPHNPDTMISLSVLSVLALIPFSVAQSSDPGLQIAAIEAHFSNAGLVPDLLSSFSPEAFLNVNFNGVGDVAPGTALTQDREFFEHFIVQRRSKVTLLRGQRGSQFVTHARKFLHSIQWEVHVSDGRCWPGMDVLSLIYTCTDTFIRSAQMSRKDKPVTC